MVIPDPPPPPRLTVRLLELMDIRASVDPVRGTCSVDTLGRSDGADLARPRRGAAFISVRRTLGLVPAGLRRVGASLLVVLLVPFRWLLGGLPRGARTGERDGSFVDAAFFESVGDTTAAAAAIRESPDVPCMSMLFTRAVGGKA